jgi:hypothetical protein
VAQRDSKRRRTFRWVSLYGWRRAVADPRQTEPHAPPPNSNPEPNGSPGLRSKCDHSTDAKLYSAMPTD